MEKQLAWFIGGCGLALWAMAQIVLKLLHKKTDSDGATSMKDSERAEHNAYGMDIAVLKKQLESSEKSLSKLDLKLDELSTQINKMKETLRLFEASHGYPK